MNYITQQNTFVWGVCLFTHPFNYEFKLIYLVYLVLSSLLLFAGIKRSPNPDFLVYNNKFTSNKLIIAKTNNVKRLLLFCLQLKSIPVFESIEKKFWCQTL